MQKLAEVCVARPVFAAVLILVLVVVGAVGFTRLGVDRFPAVENPTVTIATSYPGASPEVVEADVTSLVESAVGTISGINELRSTSSEGVSRVTVAFNLNKSADVATQEVRDRIGLIAARLPEGIDPPVVRRQDPDSAPVLGIAVAASAPIREVSEWVDKTLRPQIENADGVGEIFVAGARARQINIEPDPFALRAAGLTVSDLTRALRAGNIEIPGGQVEASGGDLTLRTAGRLRELSDFESLTVREGQGGALVRLGQVARVVDGEQNANTVAQLDGQPTVLVYVRKQSGVNTLATIAGVKERLEAARATLPPGYELRIVRDQSQYIAAAVHAVEEHLIVGAILATLVVLVFLLNWRATLIAALSIPASIIATFGVLWALGYTLNIITLLALTLAVGIVIDDTIVVIENIYRVMHERGIGPFQAAIEGTREIGLAVMATTFSLVAVFLPVAFMDGITGRLLSSFGITMSIAILVSLLVSFTLAPALGARWLGQPSRPDRGNADEAGQVPDGSHGHEPGGRFFAPIDRIYTAMLKWSMGHRWAIVGACLLALAAVPPLYQMAPFNFLPEDDESQFQISARAPEGTNLETMTGLAERLAERVRRVEGIDSTLLTINGWGPSAASNNADIFVQMRPLNERDISQAETIQKLRREVFREFAAENLRINARPLSALPGFGGGTGGRGVQWVLSGPDLDTLRAAADRMAEGARQLPGVADADTNFVEGRPEFVATIDRDLASSLGVSVSEASNTLRFLVGGQNVTSFAQGGEQYDVHLRAPLQFRADPEGIGLWSVPVAGGGSGGGSGGGTGTGAVPLDQIASFERGVGPTAIQRLNRQRQIIISANTAPGASAGDILAGMARLNASLDLPPGYIGAATGSSREQQQSLAAFFMAIGLSMVFMYLILAAQFESWLHPITILLSLPLTVPFALLSLVLFDQSLNIYSGLGILVLFGVVKKNAILQVDHTNQLREKGLSRYDAIIQANRDRLRPILMTTLAFVAGMIPLVISTGVGSGTNRAIGTVIFGGQSMALLLTLLATPVVYSLLDDLVVWSARQKANFKARLRRQSASHAPLGTGSELGGERGA